MAEPEDSQPGWTAKAPLPSAAIIIDQSEIVAFRWLSPRAALDASERGLIALLPPTFMALRLFQRRGSAAAVCSSIKRQTPHRIAPQLLRHLNPLILLCDGDKEHWTLAAPNIGARHRVVGNGAGLK